MWAQLKPKLLYPVKKIWPFSYYLAYFAALSALSPFVALYYQSVGLTGPQIGLLVGLGPLVTLVGAPLWTGLADATRRHKLVMSLTTLGVVGLVLLIPALKNFGWLLGVVALYSFMAAPLASFADSATLAMLGREPEQYGRVRVGGTVGWGAMSLFLGGWLEQHGLLWIFWIYAGGMALTLLLIQGLTFKPIAVSASTPNNWRPFITNPHWALFLALALAGGMGMASVHTYLFVYMEEAGASKTLMGLTLTLSTISELPVMLFGDWLLRRLKSRGLLALATGVIGARLLLMAAFHTPTALLLTQVVHGLTFPALWIAGVSYAHEHAPAGMQATAQGLFNAMVFGIGASAGNFVGGLLLEAVGGRGLYFIFGMIVLTGLLLYIFLERRLRAAIPSTPKWS